MRRAAIAAASTSALVVLLLTLKPHQPGIPALGAAPPAGTSPAPTGTATPPGGRGTGTYTGDAVQTQYGTVQVAATVKAGELTAVKMLQVPSGNGRDQEIAAYAVPRLTQEALGSHSAHIDSVSGASYTSQGYIQSLQSALDRAGV
ncbi:hypothetical protein GCM10011583_64180 [Streptomyces camponoticapitis]|uniref:FMN-binding domain-containing protein n=1 Tax=Streptomyces camponoticapitis TaxID=1616125 RepID=A0ABQ2EW06_9ACTN|nr:FMN-binding protein [Streptomyces camponoticapitis]GGK23425.1 hypothetical protein GCM10011583_64180 [Streptomyces camponoticapitis]